MTQNRRAIEYYPQVLGRPRVFIGSASESRHVADALNAVLSEEPVEVTVWPQVFGIANYTLDSLLEAARSHSFSVFVFSPDDTLTSRGQDYHVPRDNVVFELGLFMALQGPRHVFIVVAEGQDLKSISDLAGIATAYYKPPLATPHDDRWESALRRAGRQIMREIDRILESEEQVTSPPIVQGDSRFAEMATNDLMAAARMGRLRRAASPRVGALVVSALHGIGQVVGHDPMRGEDSILWVEFGSGLAGLPRSQLFDPTPGIEE